MNNPGMNPRIQLRGNGGVLRRAGGLMLAALLALGPFAAERAQATEGMRPRMVVTNDQGGSLRLRAQQIATMRMRGQAVAVPYGQCISACTMYLGLPGTCVGPNAVFGFHGPSSGAGFALPEAEFERWTQVMAANYPPQLRAWFLSEGRYKTVGYKKISGAQLIRMGVPRCN